MTAATAPTRLTPACAGAWGLFDRAADGDAEAVAAAKRICARCPRALQDACLDGAMERREQYGVWSGLSPDERAEIEAACWLLEPPTTERHDRSMYNAGCHCAKCSAANAAYQADRRAAKPNHKGQKTGDVEQLALLEDL